MMKKLFALLLAAVMLLGAGATALAAEPEGAGYVISIANSSTTNSLTVDLLTWEGMKNGRLELTYPEELTLVSARSTLDAENGITDLDASKPGTVHFAWAAYTAQKDGTPVLRLTFRGQHGKTYFWNVIDTETGWQSKSMLPFDYRFNDVLDENAWYYDAVYAAWDAGLMNGVGNGMFEPESSMTRAMLVTVLWRYAGSPAGWENPFTDVLNGSWFTQAVAWAAENGIVNGVGNNKFEPDSNITREQMAAILSRRARRPSRTLPRASGTPTPSTGRPSRAWSTAIPTARSARRPRSPVRKWPRCSIATGSCRAASIPRRTMSLRAIRTAVRSPIGHWRP